MYVGEYDGKWTYGHCESCMKNAREKIKMIREKIDENSPVMFVCPQCGSTKKL
jgi:hypothetical protein